MAVQYEANATSKRGGGGSGSWPKNARGPIKTNLTGYTIVERISFQPVGGTVQNAQKPILKRVRQKPKVQMGPFAQLLCKAYYKMIVKNSAGFLTCSANNYPLYVSRRGLHSGSGV